MHWDNEHNRPWHYDVGTSPRIGEGQPTDSFQWNGPALDEMRNRGLPYA